jgi:hypothetical protein
MIKERVENRTTVVLNATPLQHVSMTRKNRLIGLAFLCVTIPLMLVAQPAEKKTLVGVWEVKISAGGVPPPPLLSIASFGGDGSFTTAGNTKFPQGLGSDERGPGFGRWAQTGDRVFKLTFYAGAIEGRRSERIPASPWHLDLVRVRERVYNPRLQGGL